MTIVVSYVSLDEDSPLLTNNDVRMLFVEYHFLGVPLEETETPYSLPKPTAPNKPISFNFTKGIFISEMFPLKFSFYHYVQLMLRCSLFI